MIDQILEPVKRLSSNKITRPKVGKIEKLETIHTIALSGGDFQLETTLND